MAKKKKITSRLYLMYFLSLIPLILFGLYKNGFYLYSKNYITFINLFKPLILIIVSISGAFLGSFIREYLENGKQNTLFLDNVKPSLIESVLLAMILPIKSSPIILFLMTFICYLFLYKFKLNKIALMFIIITLINKILGLNIYENAYEIQNHLAYDGLDLFLGFGVGGICSTSVLLTFISLIYLSFNKLYKKDITYIAIISFLIFAVSINMINGTYDEIFKTIFGYNIIFSLVFIAPNLYSSSYTLKGQILSGVVLGVLTYFMNEFAPYSGVLIAIILVNLLNGVFDRIFVVK